MRIPRRNIFRALFGSVFGIGCLGLGATLVAWVAAIARFLVPNASYRPARTFKAEVPADSPMSFVETKHAPRHGVWIVREPRQASSRIYALRTTCTHLGCITQWDASQQRFRCPCHGSAFTKEGINIAGPAPRPLDRCAIRRTADGQLEIDTDRTFRQQLGQWNDPESYVET